MNENKKERNMFFSEKMSYITTKFYEYASDLSRFYYSKRCFREDEETKKWMNGWFFPPIFCIGPNIEHKAFYFFKKPPNSFNKELMSRPEAVNNYVQKFVQCLGSLFSESEFLRYVIEDENEDENEDEDEDDDLLTKFTKIICSDFAIGCDKTDIELFSGSSFLELPEALFYSGTFECIRYYLTHKNATLAKNARKMKEIILFYLENALVISPETIKHLLYDDQFYELFKDDDDNKTEQIIIDAIGKTYLVSDPYYKENKHDLKKFDNTIWTLMIKSNPSETNRNFFYFKKKDKMQPALINKLADIFSNNETNKYIYFKYLFCDCRNVAKFMLDYCKENKENEASIKLLNGLKTWLEYHMNEGDYSLRDLSDNFKKVIFENTSLLKLFALNDELKKTFVRVYEKAITIDTDLCYASLAGKKHAGMNSFLSTFGINLDNTERNHCNNVKKLAIGIIMIAIFIFAMIFCFIMAPIILVKFCTLFFLAPAYPIFCSFIEVCKEIENDRIHNAIQDIGKSKTKMEARNRIPFDMFWRKEVKDYFNQLPESENQANEIIING